MADSQNLFKNVYHLVDKQSGSEVVQDIDYAQVLDRESKFQVKPIQERTALLTRYENFYNQVPKKPQSQHLRKRPRLVQQNENQKPQHQTIDKYEIKITDFLLNSDNTIDSETSRKLQQSEVKAFQRTKSTGMVKDQNRICLKDLKENEICNKIKEKCILQNPHQQLFENTRNYRHSQHISLEKQQTKLNSGFLSPHTISQAGETDRQLIIQQLCQFERKQQFLETSKFTKNDLKLFFRRFYQIELTELQSIEGIHFCRGRQMEKSTTYSREKLIDWICIQLPILQISHQFREHTNQQIKQKARQRRQTLFSQQQQCNQTQDVDQLLRAANYNSKVKQKLVDTLVDLDTKVQEQLSKQGMLGQLAAQQRLTQQSKRVSKERKQEVQKQLVETCQYDSAVRSINLQKHMEPHWTELPNSYQVVSKLSYEQKRRLNEMTQKRLTFK